MLKRVLTTVVGLPAVVFFVYIGGLPLFIVAALVSLVGLREFYLAFSKADRPIHGVGYLFTLVYFGAIYIFDGGYWLLVAMALFIIVTKSCLVLFYKHLSIQECVTTVYGFFYVPFLLSFLVLVREHQLGQYYVWLIFIAAFGCDTFAYLTGSAFGKNKLKDSPSPSKSVEGLIGGILGAALLGGAYGFFLSRFADSEVTTFVVLNVTVVSIAGALFSIVGDMSASAVKRHTGIKDFGNIFPGHGGVLDRVDSVIFVAPIVYIVMQVMIWLVL